MGAAMTAQTAAQKTPDFRMDEPEDQVLEDATRTLNIALLALEGVFKGLPV
jgi:hypothetical protein